MIRTNAAVRAGRTFVFVTALLLVAFGRTACAGDTLFQYSTIDALLGSLFEGQLTIRDLKKEGDFGLGTLNGIDGELVLLDGEAYHVRAGGVTTVPAAGAMVPFATVSFFEGESTVELGAVTSLDGLNRAVLAELPSRNLFHAVRVDADFHSVRTRAIPRQTPPYVTLAEAAKQQVVTTFSGPGTLVGYYSPSFVKGVNVPGFHWHFLTDDRTGGGHVLDCAFAPSTATVDTLHAFTVRLPESDEFDELDLSGDKTKELHAVEKEPANKE